MGITIRYLEPAAAGTPLIYSIERRADGEFFDFVLNTFRPREKIPAYAITRPLVNHPNGHAMHAQFDDVELGKVYIVRVYRADQKGRPIVELPVTVVQYREDSASASGEKENMEPSYRSGKKFMGGKVIEARYRYTFHGDDGFTVHTATLWEDGTSSCNCPRWGPKQRDGTRSCAHSRRVLELTDNLDETGAQAKPRPASAPGARTVSRRSRIVDT